MTSEDLNKAFGLPENIDPNHTYIYRSGEYGIFEYWYQDLTGNYWRYTNAPEGDDDHDELAGEAMLDPNQPMQHTAPQFYTERGLKRNVAVPQTAQIQPNLEYDSNSARRIWAETYLSEDGVPRYTYLDKDIRENLDLWVQQQLRNTDAGLLAYRQYAVKLFNSQHPKDRIFGVILMLVDQAYYEPYEIIQATVADLEFINDTVLLLGRKFISDPDLLDFLTSLKGDRDPSSPLFVLDTVYGNNPIGKRHVYSVFAAVKVSPHFLLYWHSNHLFSKIVHRLQTEKVDVDDVLELALNELARTLSTTSDVRYLVDVKVKEALLNNYATAMEEAEEEPELPPEEEEEAEAPEEGDEETVEKSLSRVQGDDLGVAVVHSDFGGRDEAEMEFSLWLHAEPMHDITPEEEAVIEAHLADMQASEEEESEEEPEQSEEGAVKTDVDSGGEGAASEPAEEELPSSGEANE